MLLNGPECLDRAGNAVSKDHCKVQIIQTNLEISSLFLLFPQFSKSYNNNGDWLVTAILVGSDIPDLEL